MDSTYLEEQIETIYYQKQNIHAFQAYMEHFPG